MKIKKLNKIKITNFGKPNQFDVNGSYTGTPNLNNEIEPPVQDADDL